ncbi:LTA synthase family protein [Bifidobacterium pseudocatenulatum]|uniref:LTA synthase family protein n=1 Tax=Bifidobacterium pseudocatenulatum TaxID=28026 RepID=UPI001CFD92B8|nr:alkaline phosphatase family protein [Bifidobacterium pseudocatenulatum]
MLKDATMPIFSPDRHACAPSYVKLTKQPIAGGTYRPLADNEGSNACAPSTLSGHHSSKLYTQKSAIHAISDNTSVFIPNVDALHLPETADNKSGNGAFGEAGNDNIHFTPLSAEIQLAQTDKHPLMQAFEVCKQAARTTTKALSTAGHAVAKAAKNTGHAIHTAATAVKNAWHTFINFKAVQLIIKFFKKACSLWKKRMKFSYAFYAIVFLLLTTAETLFMKWTVITEPTYDPGIKVSNHKKLVEGAVGQLTKYVTNMWLTDHNHLFILNFVGLALIYLVLIFVLNRFWLATLVFGVSITAFGVANKIKMEVRTEPILPADFSFISGGNTGNIMSFVPEDRQAFVNGAVSLVTWFAIICIAFFILDRRRKFIYCSFLHPIASFKNVIGNLTRIAAAVLSVVLLVSFTWNLTVPESSVYAWAKDQGYKPQLFSTIYDAQTNGPTTTFLSLTNVKIMDKPEEYSKETMAKIADRYKSAAQSINNDRSNRLTDSTVIMILSESFSDPLRAPRVSYSIDPMPNIRALKEQTTSGLMLSPGYGGGTANIEYQEITGMSLSNFSDSMTVPYQQLVPNQKNPYAFNQIWTQRYGKESASAVHPYAQNMYLRHVDYQKFGFDYLYTDDSKVRAPYQDHIDSNPYISDSSAYQDIVDLIKDDKSGTPQFLQLVTMQNHTPYNDWYEDNEFKEANTSTELSGWERDNSDTYAKGVNYTDTATADFLNKLNEIDQPITVVFYGDHLPGIYPNSFDDSNHDLPLHETDYFIWSNAASPSSGTKLDPAISSFTSPNYFMALAAEHMNAKVTPYLALLTGLYEQVPAIGRVSFTKKWNQKGTTTYLDASGNVMSSADLSKDAKQLLNDYKLVQYDMTAGKNYLASTDFTKEL